MFRSPVLRVRMLFDWLKQGQITLSSARIHTSIRLLRTVLLSYQPSLSLNSCINADHKSERGDKATTTSTSPFHEQNVTMFYLAPFWWGKYWAWHPSNPTYMYQKTVCACPCKALSMFILRQNQTRWQSQHKQARWRRQQDRSAKWKLNTTS